MMGRSIEGTVDTAHVAYPLITNDTFLCSECWGKIPPEKHCYAIPTAERVSDGGPGLLPPIEEPYLLCSDICLAKYELRTKER